MRPDKAMGERGSHERRSVAFERGVEDYDRTRGLPAEAMGAVVRFLSFELKGHQPCLEIGVGTGRIALPLAEEDVAMTGVDLSQPMLGELRRKSGRTSPFPIVVADAVRLPFADAYFGAGLAVHVLHLIPSWREALSELARAIRRPGVLVLDIGGRGTGWWKELQERFGREAGISPLNVGLNAGEGLDEHLATLGAKLRRVERIEAAEATTVAERIDRLEAGLYSFTWRVDEATRHAAAQRCREWAERQLGQLDLPRTMSRPVLLRTYDLA